MHNFKRQSYKITLLIFLIMFSALSNFKNNTMLVLAKMFVPDGTLYTHVHLYNCHSINYKKKYFKFKFTQFNNKCTLSNICETYNLFINL